MYRRAKTIGLNALRAMRGVLARKRDRKRFLTALIFTLFSGYFFLSAVPVEAAACTEGANITLSSSCDWGVGTHTYTGTLTINSGVVVTAGSAGSPGLVVVVAENIDIQGIVSADALGNPHEAGTGFGATCSGAGGGGYGGKGGNGSCAGGITYGSITQPSSIGSGGGDYGNDGGAGGGAVKFAVSGTFTLGGTITADGASGGSNGGGGSGGSVWVDAGTLAGSGVITATGGAGNSQNGAGGGGRVAIYYDNGSVWSSISAIGGASTDNSSMEDGGAGTIYLYDGSGNGDILVAGGNLDDTNYSDQVTTSALTFDTITIKESAKYRVPSSYSLTLASGGTLTGGGAVQSSLTVSSGGTFDTGTIALTFNDIDVDHEGTIDSITNLTVQAATYSFVPGTSVFDAGTLASLTLASGGTFSTEGTSTMTVGTLTVQSGGTLTHADNSTAESNILDISATTVDIQSGGLVDVDAKGLDHEQGIGKGATCSGAAGGGYGGKGGNGGCAGGDTYGSVIQPSDLGSGGGDYGTDGGSGGGEIKFAVSGTFTLGGTISADGAYASNGGGGSGGSVWIDAGTLAGSGAVTAVGGADSNQNGGGGGGRVAIYYDNGSVWSSISTAGGASTINVSREDGGGGTIYLYDGSGNGDLIVDGGNLDDANYTDQVTSATETYDNITVKNGADYRVPDNFTLALASGGTLTGGGATQPQITLSALGTLDIVDSTVTFDDLDVYLTGELDATSITVQNGTFTDFTTSAVFTSTPSFTVGSVGILEYSGTVGRTLTSLTVQSGGTVTHTDNSTQRDHVVNVTATTIDIQSGGSVNVDYLGYDGSEGPGQGTGGGGAGGGYGGKGGDYSTNNYGGPTYGSVTQPNDLGSGAYNASTTRGLGGGAVKLVASGILTVAGTITADGYLGTASVGAGGAGGSVWLDAGTIAGSGTIGADGAAPASATGGGGGGRIAVHYTNGNPLAITYTTTGGDGGNNVANYDGGAGTLYLFDKDGDTNGDLIVGNANRVYSNYTAQVDGTSLTFDNITVKDGADYRIGSGESLTLAASGTFTGGGSQEPSITVDAGGSLDLSTQATITDCAVSNAGSLTLAATTTNTSANWVNTGTVTGVTDFTCTSGTCTNSGVFSGGLDTLTVGNAGNFIQSSTTALFSGSDLIVESGGTFTQDMTVAIDVGTVWIKTGGTLTHDDNTTTKTAMVNLNAVTVILESGSTVSADYKGFDSTEGDGQGDDGANTGTGGGGYGGAGGDGAGGANPGGTTYGSATAPDAIGSGAGDNTSVAGLQGGSGGGAIKIVASGTMTVNTTVTVDGQNGPATYGGGGSGGSIWLQANTLAGTSCVLSADGGAAYAVGTTNGGGGGGGRIYVGYLSDTSDCSTNATAAGGAKNGTGVVGTAGTITWEVMAPSIDSFTATPSSPTTTDPVTLSAQASYDGDVKRIELWLDGTIGVDAPVKTCTISPASSPATCVYLAGTLSPGNHTMAVRATGDDDTVTTDTGSFDVTGQTTSNILSLSRLKASETGVIFSLTFTPTGTDTGTLTVTFPVAFTVTSAGTDPSSSDCLTNFSYTSTTLVATKTSCSGATTLGGATLTNPGTPGVYTITWTNDNGSGQVVIMDDDQVSVSSDVDPSLSFNVGTSSSCDGTFAGNGGTLALGTLDPSAVTTSDFGGVSHICTRVTTNATSGAVVTVRSLYAALTSSSTPADDINSATATLVSGTEGYGICVGSDVGHTGKDATDPVGADPTDQAPYSSACDTTTHNVGALQTSAQSLWTLSGASQNAFARIFVKAAVATTTPAHGDYTDTLTFIATATY